MKISAYRHSSRIGVFTIGLAADGATWGVWHDSQCLDGNHPSAQSALEQLVGGHTAWPAEGDASELGLPGEIDAWEPVAGS